jgi:hypothetical protein
MTYFGFVRRLFCFCVCLFCLFTVIVACMLLVDCFIVFWLKNIISTHLAGLQDSKDFLANVISSLNGFVEPLYNCGLDQRHQSC